jgi:hypothetical protein
MNNICGDDLNLYPSIGFVNSGSAAAIAFVASATADLFNRRYATEIQKQPVSIPVLRDRAKLMPPLRGENHSRDG